MTRANFAIGLTTLCLVVYVVLANISADFGLIFLTLLITQCLLIWMVISILKDKRTSTRTFDEYFYEDADLGPGK